MARTRWAPGAAALAGAARVVDAVVSDGRSADSALARAEGEGERAAVRAIALGTLRWYLRLAPAVDALLARPAGVPGPIRALLIVSAHQVEYSRNVPEQTVDAAVDAARILRSPRSTGLVNAVLRRYLTDYRALLEGVDARPAPRTAHPAWLVRRLEEIWGERAAADPRGQQWPSADDLAGRPLTSHSSRIRCETGRSFY